jgi:hypothetical protein
VSSDFQAHLRAATNRVRQADIAGATRAIQSALNISAAYPGRKQELGRNSISSPSDTIGATALLESNNVGTLESAATDIARAENWLMLFVSCGNRIWRIFDSRDTSPTISPLLAIRFQMARPSPTSLSLVMLERETTNSIQRVPMMVSRGV